MQIKLVRLKQSHDGVTLYSTDSAGVSLAEVPGVGVAVTLPGNFERLIPWGNILFVEGQVAPTVKKRGRPPKAKATA